ncbi:MAG: tetratricopeptide repeat-containing sensor histidine kinase [Bacteroidales bacterium]
MINLKPGNRKKHIYLILLLVAGILPVYAQDSLLRAIESATGDSVKIELMLKLADSYSRTDNNQLAGEYYREAISLATVTENLKLQVSGLDKLGTHVRRAGLYDQSLEYHLHALELAPPLNDNQLLASIYNHIGVAYRRKTEDNLALKYHLTALSMAEENQDARNISYACNSIGIIYTYQKNYSEAMGYFNRALLLSNTQDNQTGIAINLNTIAWVYELQEMYDSAIVYYERSLAVNENAGNQTGMAICYNDLGKLYRTIGEYKRSLEYYGRSLDIHEHTDDLMHMSINRINLGQVYADLGDYNRSLTELNTGLEYAQQLGTKRLIMESYEQLAVTYEKIRQPETALKYIRLYAAYRDSIYNEESSRQIAEFKTLFDTEKKEKENILLASERNALDAQVKRQRLTVITVSVFLLLFTLLSIYLFVIRRKLLLYQRKVNHQNEQLIENEAKLNDMIATKDKFFKIIAHDLRNYFNGLLGYSELLENEHRELNEDERDKMIKNIAAISKNSFALLENLLVWSRSQTENLPFCPKQYMLQELVGSNLATMESQLKRKGLKLISAVDKDILVFGDKEMLNTVLRNLIMNAVKFSNEGGEIRIDAKRENERVTISVSDQGIGMSQEKLNILFDISQKTSTLGTDREKGTGLGLVLCKELIEAQGGSISVESEKGKGSVFYITLPGESPELA